MIDGQSQMDFNSQTRLKEAELSLARAEIAAQRVELDALRLRLGKEEQRSAALRCELDALLLLLPPSVSIAAKSSVVAAAGPDASVRGRGGRRIPAALLHRIEANGFDRQEMAIAVIFSTFMSTTATWSEKEMQMFERATEGLLHTSAVAVEAAAAEDDGAGETFARLCDAVGCSCELGIDYDGLFRIYSDTPLREAYDADEERDLARCYGSNRVYMGQALFEHYDRDNDSFWSQAEAATFFQSATNASRPDEGGGAFPSPSPSSSSSVELDDALWQEMCADLDVDPAVGISAEIMLQLFLNELHVGNGSPQSFEVDFDLRRDFATTFGRSAAAMSASLFRAFDFDGDGVWSMLEASAFQLMTHSSCDDDNDGGEGGEGEGEGDGGAGGGVLLLDGQWKTILATLGCEKMNGITEDALLASFTTHAASFNADVAKDWAAVFDAPHLQAQQHCVAVEEGQQEAGHGCTIQ